MLSQQNIIHRVTGPCTRKRGCLAHDGWFFQSLMTIGRSLRYSIPSSSIVRAEIKSECEFFPFLLTNNFLSLNYTTSKPARYSAPSRLRLVIKKSPHEKDLSFNDILILNFEQFKEKLNNSLSFKGAIWSSNDILILNFEQFKEKHYNSLSFKSAISILEL